jgi:hypothetical protein
MLLLKHAVIGLNCLFLRGAYQTFHLAGFCIYFSTSSKNPSSNIVRQHLVPNIMPTISNPVTQQYFMILGTSTVTLTLTFTLAAESVSFDEQQFLDITTPHFPFTYDTFS